MTYSDHISVGSNLSEHSHEKIRQSHVNINELLNGGQVLSQLHHCVDGQNKLVNVNGITGVLVNKDEIENWRGEIPLNEYPINNDPNPVIIRKQLTSSPQTVFQDVIIRYLEPPLSQQGEIIIQQEEPQIPPPAPPIHIREEQYEHQHHQDCTLIYREVPPLISKSSPERKVVKILAPKIPPPPRKLIVERPPPNVEPQHQSIIIERWLAPPEQPPRRIVFDGETHAHFNGYEGVRNEIIEYEVPDDDTVFNQNVIELGVSAMNPDEYRDKYGNQLIECHRLPDFVKEIRPTPGFTLFGDVLYEIPPLVGDIEALLLIPDLDEVGLGEYKSFLEELLRCQTITTYTIDDDIPLIDETNHQPPEETVKPIEYVPEREDESVTDKDDEYVEKEIIIKDDSKKRPIKKDKKPKSNGFKCCCRSLKIIAPKI